MESVVRLPLPLGEGCGEGRSYGTVEEGKSNLSFHAKPSP